MKKWFCGCLLSKLSDSKGGGSFDLVTALFRLSVCLSVILCALMLFVPFSTVAMAASSGDWQYSTSYGKATITKYTGTETEIITPTELGGYPVTSIGAGSFQNSSVRRITISEGITTIGDHAFSHSYVYEVNFPSSLVAIDTYAFSYCSSLTNINLPEGVEEVGDFAFISCSSAAFYNKGTITLPSTLRTLGISAFKDCKYIDTLQIAEGLTTIPQSAFEGCISLTELHLPDTVRDIGINAFAGCQKWTAITLSDYITSIGNGAFKNCTGMTQIQLPHGLSEISENLFQGCTKLQSIEIPSQVTSIGANAFNKCTSLQTITIPASVVTISGNPVTGCPNVQLVFAEGSPFRTENGLLITTVDNAVVAGLNVSGHVTIPDGITSIADSAFASCEEVTTVTIPNSVTSIGVSAFRYCYGLTSISIPDSVSSIGGGAFGGCSALTTARLPEGLLSIGAAMFSDCRSMTSVNIPQTVTRIEFNAFEYCSSISSIVIPRSVSIIESNAFYNCTGLQKVFLFVQKDATNNVNIADTAFYGCSSFVVYAANGTAAYQWAQDKGYAVQDLQYEFSVQNGEATITKYIGMTIQQIVSIPGNMDGYPVTRIGQEAFKGHYEITTVSIPSTVKVIEDRAFINCGIVTVGGNMSLGTYGVTLPQGLLEIGDGAFVSAS